MEVRGNTGLLPPFILLLSIVSKACAGLKPVLKLDKAFISGAFSSEKENNFGMTCSAPNGVSDILSITISRKLLETRGADNPNPVNDTEDLARIKKGASKDASTLLAKADNYSSSGRVIQTAGQLKLTITNVGCWDAATYKCEINYKDSDLKEATDSSTQYLLVGPSELSLERSPSDDQVESNTEVNLTCGGNVGSEFPSSNLETKFVWQEKVDNLFKTYENSLDIYTVDTQEKQGCFYKKYTSLIKKVSISDSNKEFRCLVSKKTSPSTDPTSFTDQAVTILMPIVKPPEPDAAISPAALVGIGAGVGAVVLCFVGGWVMRFRRKAAKRANKAASKVGLSTAPKQQLPPPSPSSAPVSTVSVADSPSQGEASVASTASVASDAPSVSVAESSASAAEPSVAESSAAAPSGAESSVVN